MAESESWEGWYSDPFARHEARWMSDGKPTKLVRDHGMESYDQPPDEPPSQVPEIIDPLVLDGGVDGYRAEDAWGDRDPPFTPSWGDSYLDPPPGRGLPQAGQPNKPKRKP